jgi:hypothetical protein
MPAAARQPLEDARGTVDRLDPPRFVRFPLVFGIVESKWSLQGGAHWSAASEWRGWRPDGVPSPGATSAKLVDSRQKRR